MSRKKSNGNCQRCLSSQVLQCIRSVGRDLLSFKIGSLVLSEGHFMNKIFWFLGDSVRLVIIKDNLSHIWLIGDSEIKVMPVSAESLLNNGLRAHSAPADSKTTGQQSPHTDSAGQLQQCRDTYIVQEQNKVQKNL